MAAADAPRATDWLAVWVVLAAGFAAGGTLAKVPPSIPALRAALGLDLVQAGFIQAVLYATGACVGVFGGALADRFGQKRFAQLGLALMAAGGIAGGLSQSYPLLLVTRFCEGIGFILTTVSAAALLASATEPRDRAAAFSLWSTYMPTGGTLVLLAAPIALATLGWRSLWLGLAAYTLICMAMVARWVPVPPPGPRVSSLRLLADSLARPGALALCLAFACYVGQWTSLMTWLPTFVIDERGLSRTAASLLTAAFVGINIPGNLLGGLLLRLGMRRGTVMLLGALAMGGSAIGILSPAPDAVRLACVLGFSFLGGIIPAAVFAGTPVHAKSPGHIGTVNGMVMQASHLSQFTVPVAIAWIASRAGGWSASLGVMLALACAGVAAALAVARFERR